MMRGLTAIITLLSSLGALLTEAGAFLLTEAGDVMITE